VYNRLFKREETGTGDDYQITIEIENDSFDNLYYSRKENIMAGEKDPLLPPYLTIQVLNSADPSKKEFYVHGGITLHMSADSTQIFKVTMKRNEHEFKSRIKKGEPPELRCFFNEYLLPWEQVKVLKLKFK